MKTLFFLTLLCMAINISAEDKKPNVLLISVDDLNDWITCLDGHPQAKTPNMNRLAERGTLFANAHCQAPVCQPSRSSLMTSTYPSSTGLYFLSPGIKDSPVTNNVLTMPERFKKEGYKIYGAGKLFHNKMNKKIFGSTGEYFSSGGFGPTPKKKVNYLIGHPLWDWGAYPERDEDMPDYKMAKWGIKKLKEKHEKPFFMALGFYRPHVPLYVPKKWFDMFPLEEIQLPKIDKNDNADVPQYAKNLTNLKQVAPTHKWILENDKQWQKAIQAYLASIAFVDHYIGEILDTLDKSPYADNTIVVMFSDHGFHMGEKERWAKRSLWEDGTRVPIIISGNGLNGKQVSKRPVGLIDLYPTLLDLCGLEKDKSHEGQSIKALLNDPKMEWKTPVRTTFGLGNHSIKSTRWRYIKYVDGSEELYDLDKDQNE
ncbi:MAG: sulfatase, partial [Lentisphaeraceae bacterium]|nr:sulfatase [Lentisphaeraceae bacterium]